MTSDREAPGRYASPPCMAAEVDPAYFDPLAVDPEQAHDVARWRRAERARLRSERDALSVADRQAAGAAIAGHLADLLRQRFGSLRGGCSRATGRSRQSLTFGRCWRPCTPKVPGRLPLVEVKAAPLVFRRWTPETRMVRGDWNIPVPPPEAEVVTPEIALAPVVGWTAEGFRLGYGGGYFDRTLATLSPRPFTIGIGFQSARLATIYPQPHDIALDAVVTEAGIAVPPYGR